MIVTIDTRAIEKLRKSTKHPTQLVMHDGWLGLEIQLTNNWYTIYSDGVCYSENGKDIPSYIFKIRDKFIKLIRR